MPKQLGYPMALCTYRSIRCPVTDGFEHYDRDRKFQRRVVVESEDHLTDFGDDGDGRDDDDDDDNVDDDNDINEDGEEGEGEDDSDYSLDTEDAGGLEGNEDGSVMCLYMKAIRKQIQEESNTMEPIPNEQRWIFNYLKEHGFWIRKECAPYICNRIGIDMHLSGYYHDVMIWLPDVQFGIKALNFALLVTFTFEDSNFLAFNNFLDTLIYHFELP